MDRRMKGLIDKLAENTSLALEEYEELLDGYSIETAQYLRERSVDVRKKVYGNTVFIRGLIEFSNICRNDCKYCGIRKSNHKVERYRLTKEQILDCCRVGYDVGFRTFVLQSGEDGYFTDDIMCDIVAAVHRTYSDCAVTLSLGERSEESYKRLKEAGADRYLLRHETADRGHYEMLHPAEMSYENRKMCLMTLKEIGYQVGCGFMVGSPYQTNRRLAEDLKFIEEFSPDMCGIGPFIPHKDTPFGKENSGTLELTCYLLSIIRLIKPNVLLPATTALSTICEHGREEGILSGANVIMPNLSPVNFRDKYEIYENKKCDGKEAAEGLDALKKRMEDIGYRIVTSRGDIMKI